MDIELVTCFSCGREWDGNAQCNCYQNMYLPVSVSDSDREEEEEVFTPSPRKTVLAEPTNLKKKDASTQTEKERIILTPLEKAQKAVDGQLSRIINIQMIV